MRETDLNLIRWGTTSWRQGASPVLWTPQVHLECQLSAVLIPSGRTDHAQGEFVGHIRQDNKHLSKQIAGK